MVNYLPYICSKMLSNITLNKNTFILSYSFRKQFYSEGCYFYNTLFVEIFF